MTNIERIDVGDNTYINIEKWNDGYTGHLIGIYEGKFLRIAQTTRPRSKSTTVEILKKEAARYDI